MFTRSHLFLSLFLLLSLSAAALAQGYGFTFQGRLTDSANPADGLFEMQFKLFDTATVGTGTQQGATIINSMVQVENGAFGVELDFAPCASCFDGSARFLEIGIRPAGSVDPYTVLSPRQPITSAPYALRAMDATQLGGVAASGFIQNTTMQQAGTNFNIGGNGTAGGTLSANVVNATAQYNIGGSRVLSVTGAANVFAGVNAGASNTTGGANSFFGKEAGFSNTTGPGNSFFGSGAGFNNTTGGNNSFFGASAGQSITIENATTFIGAFSDGQTNIFNATAIGYRSKVTQSNSLVLGSINGVNLATADTNVGIGTTAPADRLHVNGIIRVNTLGGAGSTGVCRNASNQLSTCSSSLRYKDRLAPFTSGLELINRLRPITFSWKQTGERDLGLAAEEVAAVEPLLVTYNERGQVEGVKYDRINIALINAVRQQQAQIAQHQDEIKRQQAQIDSLKKQVCLDHPNAEICKPAK